MRIFETRQKVWLIGPIFETLTFYKKCLKKRVLKISHWKYTYIEKIKQNNWMLIIQPFEKNYEMNVKSSSDITINTCWCRM